MSLNLVDYQARLLYERNSLGWPNALPWEELEEESRNIYRHYIEEKNNRNTSTSGSPTK